MGIKILRKGLPVVGFCKIGEPGIPKPGKKMAPPTKFDHFELTGVERDEHGRLYTNVDLMLQLIEAGARTCGGCKRSKDLAEAFDEPALAAGLPVEMKILLPFNDPELNFPNRLAYHKGRTEFCTGDGESAMRRKITGYDQVEGRKVPILGEPEPWGPCGNECPDFGENCKPKARLRFILGHQANVGGCFEFRTTSWNSIANISESLEMIQVAAGGTLQWIPLTLDLVPQTVQPRKGGRASKAWIARVYYSGSPMELLGRVRENLQLRAPMMQEIRQLEASIRDREWMQTPEEIQDFREEFDHEGLAAEGAIDVEASEPAQDQPEQGEQPEPPSEPADPEPADPEEPGPPTNEEPPSDPEVSTITRDEQLKLWNLCRERAKKLSQHAGKTVDPGALLRSVLDELGVKKSDQIPASEIGRALNLALNAKVPA